ncbi:hypothetical protein AGOR_G00215320 [Albula goreensis]|uniref:Selenoprotein T n=1 Tax=Albula goreensis TaxID=1534307 RepID=A0A8T3CP00_9TELE|nr:hypothetical protein AGOR_G00215320 [Albula goreensis]
MLGMDTPRIWLWSQDNKIFSCLMTFFLSNMVETHFLSTGAFEITLNDVPIWSKLQSGHLRSAGFHDDSLVPGAVSQVCGTVLWRNEGLHCKQFAVSPGWMSLPLRTLPPT